MSRCFVTLVALALPLVAPAAEPNLKAVEEQIQKVAEGVGPSVVSIVVSHSKSYTPLRNPRPGQLGVVDPNDLAMPEMFPRGFRRMQQVVIPSPLDLTVPENAADHLFGSGVVLDADAGLVLTPYHLIEGARKVYVRGSNGKGSYADIHAADAKCDLAVLKLITPLAGMKAVKLAELRLTSGPDGEKPTIKKGAMVVALGHPTAAAAGEGSASLSLGTLSNINLRSAQSTGQSGVTEMLRQRPLHQQGGLIQIDARAAFGSTGAAVFDTDGALIGVGSSVAAVSGSEASGGYATPMDANYRRVVAVLKEGKEVEYGFLGVSPFDTGGHGVSVNNVTPGCPAALAGIQNGDVLLAIDGNRLTGPDDLLLHAGGALAGTEVTVEFDRNGRKQKAKLTLAKNVNQLPFIATVFPPAPFGVKIDYFSMRAAGGGLPERNPPTPPPGVLIREVEPGSAGERALKALPSQPIKGSWLVTHVDGKPVSTPKEFFALAAGKKSLKLHLADPDQPSTKDVITLP